MVAATNFWMLRELIGPVVARLSGYTHRELEGECTRLGLPVPPIEGSKRERVDQSFATLPDADLPAVAARILQDHFLRPDAATRNAIQDVLSASRDMPEIPKRTRREIARDFDLSELVVSADRFTGSRQS
jgi:hypothetical protein